MSRQNLEVVQVLVSLVAIGLVIVGWRWRKEEQSSHRGRKLTAAWLVLAVISVLAHYRFSLDAIVRRYDSYDLVHYYLSSKYFPELGYTRLYQACVVADMEGRNRFGSFSSIRDLFDQKVRGAAALEAIREHPEEVKRHFSPGRWREFLRDFRVLDARLRKKTWRRIIVDRGYNATPTWHFVGHQLTSLVPAKHLKWLCQLDTLLVVLMFLAVARAYGLRTMAIGVTWLGIGFSTHWPGIGWALLRYDWLAASVAATCLVRRERWATAGALLGYATLVRVFPGVLLLGMFVKGAHALVAERRLDRGAVRVAAGFLAVVVVGSALTWRVLGSEHFDAFRHDLEIQLAPENLSVNRMGLAIALAYRGETSAKELGPGGRPARYAAAGRMGTLRTAIGLSALALLAISFFPRRSALPARRDDDLLQLGFLGFALLLTASFYYWTLRLAMIVLHARHSALSRWDAIGLCTLFGLEAYSGAFERLLDFRYGLTASLSVLVSLYCIGVCIVRFRAARRRN